MGITPDIITVVEMLVDECVVQFAHTFIAKNFWHLIRNLIFAIFLETLSVIIFLFSLLSICTPKNLLNFVSEINQ